MNLAAARNVRLYPWFRFFQGLIFWQAIWFLYFQETLSAADAVLMYAIFDVSATSLEVPLGVLSDRIGRRITLILSSVAGALAALLIAFSSSFEMFALANLLLGAWVALTSGTDSAFLYESLEADGKASDIEAHELTAWRFNFTALALSAVLGGIMAYYSYVLPYLAVAAGLVASGLIAWKFEDLGQGKLRAIDRVTTAQAMKEALRKPVLIWLFVLSLVMYGFSHIPFVFGQPFILEALEGIGLDSGAAVISGLVTAVMMVLSVLVSLLAPRIRNRIGLVSTLLLAFALQILIVAVLALTNSVIAIVFLFLRMIPDSLSRPFILARIQPELRDETRATYLSLQSFCGRLFFAATLYMAAGQASDTSAMAYNEIQTVLGWYVGFGVVALTGLGIWARRVALAQNNNA